MVSLIGGCSSVNTKGNSIPPPLQGAAKPAPQEAAPPPESLSQAPEAPSQKSPDGRIRIGLLLPLSGPSEALGQAMLNAASLALFDFNDPRLVLIPEDAADSAEQGERAATAALDSGADLILGPVFARAVTGAAAAARARHVNIVAFSNDRLAAGPGVYLLGFLPADEVHRIITFAVHQGMTKFAALTPSTAYGDRVREALKSVIGETQSELVAAESFPEQTSLMGDPVRRIAQALGRPPNGEGNWTPNYQAVMLAEGGTLLTSLAALLPYYEIDTSKIRVLGTGLWDDPRIGREPTLVGGWFAAADPETRRDFTERYQKAFGRTPPRIASLAYDAVALSAVLAKEAADGPFSAEHLTQPQGFAGVDGIFRLLDNGLSERGLAVMEVERGGFKIIDPAPGSFLAVPAF